MRGLVTLVVVRVEVKPWTLRVGEKVGKLKSGEDLRYSGTFPLRRAVKVQGKTLKQVEVEVPLINAHQNLDILFERILNWLVPFRRPMS